MLEKKMKNTKWKQMDARISTKQAVVLGRVTQSFMNKVNPKVNSIGARSIV